MFSFAACRRNNQQAANIWMRRIAMRTFGMKFRNLCFFSFGFLILDMSTASAAIIYVPSQSGLSLNAQAGQDYQYVNLYNPGPTSYTNTISAAWSESRTSGDVTTYAFANASASLDMSADVVGAFSQHPGLITVQQPDGLVLLVTSRRTCDLS
jgi:hypothetical protein